jgi:hypothetical protein
MSMTSPPSATCRHYGMPERHRKCEWQEGKQTCALLSNGVPLRVLRVQARIAMRVGTINRYKDGKGGWRKCGAKPIG